MKDKKILELIAQEEKRQKQGIELIPSENYASTAVRNCLSSVLTNKYSEGYPKKRYYGGNDVVDDVEILAQERAKKLFGVPFVNVQPYSGSPANLAVVIALFIIWKFKVPGFFITLGTLFILVSLFTNLIYERTTAIVIGLVIVGIGFLLRRDVREHTKDLRTH